MITCPRCGSIHIRVHAPLQRIVWGKKHALWGPVVPRGTTAALEVSCGNCSFAFVSKPDGSFEQAPIQAAYDALMATQKAVLDAKAKDKGPSSDKEARPSRPMARPAPDPRVKPRP